MVLVLLLPFLAFEPNPKLALLLHPLNDAAALTLLALIVAPSVFALALVLLFIIILMFLVGFDILVAVSYDTVFGA